MRPIDLIVVHHSASSPKTTVAQIRKWHVDDHGWSDIGYHRIIVGDGSVWDGRPVQASGAHSRGSNKSSIGICVTGDNTVSDYRWTEAQHKALEHTLLYYADLYPAARVCGHRDTPRASTLCPGLDIGEWCRERGVPVMLLPPDN